MGKTSFDFDSGNIQATGVGIREGEVAALDTIGEIMGEYFNSAPIARNALMRIAIRRFLEDFESENITPQTLTAYFTVPERPQPKLKLGE